jgi:hypothetical protein
MEEEKEQRGFRVTDRRRFSEAGELKSEASAETPPPEPPAGAAPAEGRPARGRADEPVTFSTFVLGLSTQALLHLGEIPNPVTRAVEPDLEAAKQVIDILGILREKTRSNLETSEDALLDSILYDLRLRYVDLVRQQRKEGA